MLADLVAQRLHHEAGFVRIQARAVDQPARGLVDRDQMFVAPEHMQGGGVVGGRQIGQGAGPEKKRRGGPAL
ncbi:hypothetical protein D3C78_1922420 [compost metagenome]